MEPGKNELTKRDYLIVGLTLIGLFLAVGSGFGYGVSETTFWPGIGLKAAFLCHVPLIVLAVKHNRIVWDLLLWVSLVGLCGLASLAVGWLVNLFIS